MSSHPPAASRLFLSLVVMSGSLYTTNMTDAPAAAAPSFHRRDRLVAIEAQVQTKWESMNVYESTPDAALSGPDDTFMVTFPYPYMNGLLHLGHGFSVTKAEFAARFQRMLGKNVLFPFAFHCTGMPIAAAANKLTREIETYGNPPVFPPLEIEVVEESIEKEPVVATSAPGEGKKFTANKTKVAQKTGGATNQRPLFQFEICRMSGIPDAEIPLFRDPKHWLSYFPPLGVRDLKRFGLAVDWRRSFITTDVNPYYDSFIRWQFNLLKKRERIAFGARQSIFSPRDGQPCADHDRASGEGVGPQEYVVIKLRVCDPFPSVLHALNGRRVFFGAATLRPETMYGQTNLWLLPTGEYGAFELSNGDVLIMSERAALNMSYQHLMPTFGQPLCLLKGLKGSDLMGVAVEGPLAVHQRFYTLPLMTISMGKGTGVVTSVPSDSPDDYAAFSDIRKKAALREKYGITDNMVEPFTIIPIIHTDEFGDVAAETVCLALKIASQNDALKLAEAKEKVYRAGFYNGTMIVGSCNGMKVQDAKVKVRDEIIAAGNAFLYSEPEKTVISRSGDECVVALVDQWYLKYGDAEWCASVKKHFENSFETYSPQVKKAFADTLDWLKEWACSRNFGLGTRLPWDPQFLIESLSDSTIYMAYYTIAHLLQGGVMDGSKIGPAGIRPDQLSDSVWDFIFDQTVEAPSESVTGIAANTLVALRKEFMYWYPMNLRVSGKDLIQNHLTMALYNHEAIWGDRYMPKGVYCNGFIQVNKEKMSKLMGNFITMQDACRDFSADGTRFSLADAGDSIEFANFVVDTANTGILKLTNLEEWFKEMTGLIDNGKFRSGPMTSFFDRAFDASMSKVVADANMAYRRMLFRDALKSSFFELQQARDAYRVEMGGDTDMHVDLVRRFMELQVLLIAPITPHICEHLWSNVLKRDGVVANARFPAVVDYDSSIIRAHAYFQHVIHATRVQLDRTLNPKKKPKEPIVPPTGIRIYICSEFPWWMVKTLRIMRASFDPASNTLTKDSSEFAAELKACPEFQGKLMKNAMSFCANVREEIATRGAEALEESLPFNEMTILSELRSNIMAELKVSHVELVESTAAGIVDPENRAPDSMPGKPLASFF